MSVQPAIDTRSEQPYVAIPTRATFKEWGAVNALVGEVFGWLGQHGIPPAGPLFYRYRTLGDSEHAFTLEVGVPTPHAVPCDERVQSGSIPAGRYATLVHTGHPDGIGAKHAALRDWVRKEGLTLNNHQQDGHEVWGGCFEFYLTNPAEQPDPARWSTQLAYQLR